MVLATPLTAAEGDALAQRIAAVESRTGTQIVTLLVAKSDAYVELPWIAFALGASLAAFSVVLFDLLRPDWVTKYLVLSGAVAILGAGGALALLAIFVPAFARIFLREARVAVEVRQYAESQFLARELFLVDGRTGILVLVSLFERRIELVADTGYAGRVRPEDWHVVVARMTPLLHAGRIADALHEGVAALQELLVSKGFPGGDDAATSFPERPFVASGP